MQEQTGNPPKQKSEKGFITANDDGQEDVSKQKYRINPP